MQWYARKERREKKREKRYRNRKSTLQYIYLEEVRACSVIGVCIWICGQHAANPKTLTSTELNAECIQMLHKTLQ
jgi:hypothetical protein